MEKIEGKKIKLTEQQLKNFIAEETAKFKKRIELEKKREEILSELKKI